VDKHKSLAGAGMQTDAAGVRRTSRMRVRPLEYWRNEKVVYSRKYAELPTVHHVVMHSPQTKRRRKL